MEALPYREIDIQPKRDTLFSMDEFNAMPFEKQLEFMAGSDGNPSCAASWGTEPGKGKSLSRLDTAARIQRIEKGTS
jgi:hypothetical protein